MYVWVYNVWVCVWVCGKVYSTTDGNILPVSTVCLSKQPQIDLFSCSDIPVCKYVCVVSMCVCVCMCVCVMLGR